MSGASPRTAALAARVLECPPSPNHPLCSQIWILPPTASRYLTLALPTATTPAFCLSSPPLSLVLMVDAEVMLIFPLLFHKWSKSNKENEKQKKPNTISGKFGRWLELFPSKDGRAARRREIKWRCTGRGMELCSACCQEHLLGRQGLSWGTKPKSLLCPSGMRKPAEAATASLLSSWSISPELLQVLFRLSREQLFTFSSWLCHSFSFYLISVFILIISFLLLSLALFFFSPLQFTWLLI